MGKKSLTMEALRLGSILFSTGQRGMNKSNSKIIASRLLQLNMIYRNLSITFRQCQIKAFQKIAKKQRFPYLSERLAQEVSKEKLPDAVLCVWHAGAQHCLSAFEFYTIHRISTSLKLPQIRLFKRCRQPSFRVCPSWFAFQKCRIFIFKKNLI